jgi:hypothetical protein
MQDNAGGEGKERDLERSKNEKGEGKGKGKEASFPFASLLSSLSLSRSLARFSITSPLFFFLSLLLF